MVQDNDLKPGEKKSPDGNGQPEKNTPDFPDLSDIEEEIDDTLDGVDQTQIKDDGETVEISKAQLDKLSRDLSHYKIGLKGIKKKLKGKMPKVVQHPAGDFVTRKELQDSIEKTAIAEAHKDNAVKSNWNEILPYFIPRHGKESVSAILADINDAYFLWKRDNPDKGKDPSSDKIADLAADKTKVDTDTQAKGDPGKDRKHILPKPTSVADWYKKPEGK